MAAVDEKKYDRQLRLWGSHGQKALSESRICLLTASATGCEVLKNLILPGIGFFTVVDGAKVTATDLGENFFFEEKDIGASRAESATRLLRELNEDVQGSHVEEDPKALVEHNKAFFADFDVIIASSLTEDVELKIGVICEELNKCLVCVRSYGLIGYVRLYKKEHTIVESRPDFAEADLRVAHPFPALLEYCENYDVDTTDTMEQAHIPFIVLLVRALDEWKRSHDGSLPTSRDDKNALKERIREIAKDDNSGQRDNVREALQAVFKACQPTQLSARQRAVLDDPLAQELTADSSNFWIIANAVSSFISSTGFPPLVGSIPDMTSTSDSYVSLQKLYRAKAQEDIQEITTVISASLTRLGRQQDQVSADEVKTFCKNVFNVQVLRYRPLSAEFTLPGTTGEASSSVTASSLANDLCQGPTAPSALYILLRAADRFFQKHARFPGAHEDDDMDTDLSVIKSIIQTLFGEYGISNVTIPDTYAQDLVRYGACELHNMAAVIGGVASQEVIKLVTSQFVPINNTFIYSGLHSSAASFEF